MRIAFISRRFFPAISGMSVYAANLLREMVAAGHDLTMISQYRGDDFGKRVYGGGPPPTVAGVRVIGLEQLGEQDGGDFERDIATMQRTIAAEHARQPFDVLHAQYGYPTGWAALQAGRTLGLPVVVSIQGGDGHWVGACCGTHRVAMQAVLDHANAVLIGCRSFADEVIGRLGTDPARFMIVPGAVDVTQFTPAPAPPAEPTLLYHGRVDRRKGALDLMDAYDQLAREGIAPPLIVSGIGPDFTAMAERVAHHPRASMRGYVAYENVPAIYREADIFVSPTYAEGFSNTVLEAMASGLACVSCRAVGVVDCLRDEENGLLTDPGDVPALTTALRRVLQDDALRRRLAAVGLAACRQLYAWPPVAAQIMEVYRTVCGQRPHPGFPDALAIEPCRFRADPHLL